MEIQHATLAMVRKGRNGRRVLVERDVLDVADRLREIDPALKVYWNEYAEYFVIAETLADGSESLVTTCLELTPAVVDHVRRLPHLRYASELERRDDEARRARDHEFHEQVGEVGERLAHAVRQDLGATHRAFIPGDV